VTYASPTTKEPGPRRRWALVGAILMGSSLLLWVALLGVPFVPLSVSGRAVLATSVIVVAEVAFWGGAALAGPEAARRMRSWWRRPASELGEAPEDSSN
jgi:hypothetical protein